MSYIPDCRNDEDYNQKYLNDKDKEFVRGYDWCTEEVVDNFFNNMDVYFDEDSHLLHLLNEKLPEHLKDEEEIEWTFGRETTVRKIDTYADLFRAALEEWIESERDELITSMIDNMDDSELEANRQKAYEEDR